ncbi:hypothetical protein ACFQUU_02565 [Herbaspirillum sp. GCM10030257]|uniref:hypothetical protein n=1 Tax=Herbaspirillum sp. GCM10030257 TaxID=3273393 RepID=UPI00361D62CA
MKENSVWLYIKVVCVLAYLYIAAAVICCLPRLFVVRHPALKPTGYGLDKEALGKSGVHMESA